MKHDARISRWCVSLGIYCEFSLYVVRKRVENSLPKRLTKWWISPCLSTKQIQIMWLITNVRTFFVGQTKVHWVVLRWYDSTSAIKQHYWIVWTLNHLIRSTVALDTKLSKTLFNLFLFNVNFSVRESCLWLTIYKFTTRKHIENIYI